MSTAQIMIQISSTALFSHLFFLFEACVVGLYVSECVKDCKILLYRNITNFFILNLNDCTERRLWKVGTEGIRSTAAVGGI